MQNKQTVNWWLVTGSFMLAFIATIVPLPQLIVWYRPEFVVLVLIYWCSFAPTKISVGYGWFMGLLLDSLRGALLGQNALALALVAYFSVQMQQRFRLFPVWQQALCVFIMISGAGMIVLWIQGLISSPPVTWRYWMPSCTSMLLWPWMQWLLDTSRVRAEQRALTHV